MLVQYRKENNDASSLVIKNRPGPPRFTDLMFYRLRLVTYDDYYRQLAIKYSAMRTVVDVKWCLLLFWKRQCCRFAITAKLLKLTVT